MSIIENLQETIETIDTEINNLKHLIEHAQSGIEKCFERIENLENFIRKPHKCPICEGKGYWHAIDKNISTGGRCTSCEGKGIVWG